MLRPTRLSSTLHFDEHGAEEARRAFNEDRRWKHGSIYVFVDGIAKLGIEQYTFVHPPDPSREGRFWGESVDDFGTELAAEVYRLMEVVDSGWTYYSFTNPRTGRRQPKASYLIEIDWKGNRAAIGAGVYSPDWPGTCFAEDVSAALLDANPGDDALRHFVRCASLVLAEKGFFAKGELESGSRWKHGSAYLFVLDMMGHQIMSGGSGPGHRANLHELGLWHTAVDQFGGRDMIGTVDTFGEAYVYYRAINPGTGANEPKVGFLKRVVVQGVPLLIGSGYYPRSGVPDEPPGCDEKFLVASAVRTSDDLQAFVRCAAEYVQRHGSDEAYRAFHEDARWCYLSHYLARKWAVFVKLDDSR